MAGQRPRRARYEAADDEGADQHRFGLCQRVEREGRHAPKNACRTGAERKTGGPGAGISRRRGAPTVSDEEMGADRSNGHRADERLVLDDLNKATKVVALALLDLLGT